MFHRISIDNGFCADVYNIGKWYLAQGLGKDRKFSEVKFVIEIGRVLNLFAYEGDII